VGPRAALDTEAGGEILLTLLRIEPRSPGRPARSETLNCLSYSADKLHKEHFIICSLQILWVMDKKTAQVRRRKRIQNF
jgi:hypothetical protein